MVSRQGVKPAKNTNYPALMSVPLDCGLHRNDDGGVIGIPIQTTVRRVT